MLCCVPKRLANGGPFYDEAPFHARADNSPPSSIREIRIELVPEEGEPAFFDPASDFMVSFFLELLSYRMSFARVFEPFLNDRRIVWKCAYLAPRLTKCVL